MWACCHSNQALSYDKVLMLSRVRKHQPSVCKPTASHACGTASGGGGRRQMLPSSMSSAAMALPVIPMYGMLLSHMLSCLIRLQTTPAVSERHGQWHVLMTSTTAEHHLRSELTRKQEWCV